MKWGEGRGQNQQNLQEKNCQGRTKKVVSDKPFHQSSSRTAISDTCERSGEMLNGRSRAVGGYLCLKDLFVLCVTHKHRVQNVKSLTHLPLCSCKSRAQLSHVLADHPDFHVPEDWGGAEGAGGFSCCHCLCSDKIIKYTRSGVWVCYIWTYLSGLSTAPLGCPTLPWVLRQEFRRV